MRLHPALRPTLCYNFYIRIICCVKQYAARFYSLQGGIRLSRYQQLILFWLRTLGFLLILGTVLSYMLFVLVPKHDYGICSMTNLYQQEENTVDMLVIGTSAAQAGINTNVLWEEQGIAAYDLCSAELPYWASYYYLKEALRTQTPQLLVLDAKPSIYTQTYSRKARVFMSTYGIKSLDNRIGAILSSVHPDNRVKFLLGFSELHGNYETLTANDFVYPPDNGGRGSNWKGFIGYEECLDFEEPWGDTSSDATMPIHEKQQQYFELILQLAREKDLNVLVIGFPTPDYVHDHPYFNTIKLLAEKHGAAYLNYNQPDIVGMWDFTTDFADWQHLNIRGSVKLSMHLGEYVKNAYSLPDRRGQEGYASYDAETAAWYLQYADHPLLDDSL